MKNDFHPGEKMEEMTKKSITFATDMNDSERLLRYILGFQGSFYLATNLWALVATQNFLSYTNPQSDVFEARSFAALCLVVTFFFLAGVIRKDLLRPAAFLGLGSAIAIALVELFHLPNMGWSLLWLDLPIEVALAGLYVTMFFFREELKPVDMQLPEEQKADEILPVTEEISPREEAGNEAPMNTSL